MTTQMLYRIDRAGKIRRTQIDEHKRFPSILAFSLGFLMPIATIAGIWPPALIVLRVALIFLILFVTHDLKEKAPANRLTHAIGAFLIVMGAILVIRLLFLGGDLTSAVFLLFSPILALLVLRHRSLYRSLLLGFVGGTSWSAFDIVLQVVGLPYLGTTSESGFRYGGFSGSSTQVAPLLAVAICIVVTPWVWERRRSLLRAVLAVLLFTGLILSQGRVGLAGLLAALVILLLSLFPRRPLLVSTVLIFFSILVGVTGLAATFIDYVTRSEIGSDVDFSSGRFDLNLAAWEAFAYSAPFPVQPEIRAHLTPHVAMLTAGIDLGLVGMLAISAVVILLFCLAVFGNGPLLFRMIAAITVVTAFLEPYAFFENFTKVTLLLMCTTCLTLGRSFQVESASGGCPASDEGGVRRIGMGGNFDGRLKSLRLDE